MERMPITSSNIRSIGYDAEIQVLEVEFTNGNVYAYTAVPVDVADGLFAAESKGTYLSKHVKGRYSYTQV